ncbi:MAG: hypothetical protein WA977_04380 [Halobacteriota archaeon]
MRIVDIDKIKVEPLRDSVSPEIRFDIPLYYRAKYEMPIAAMGILLSEDGKKISDLTEMVTDVSKTSELAAKDIAASESEKEEEIVLSMVAKLDPIALDHIEDLRSKNSKGDVKLSLEIVVRTLNSHTILSYLLLHKGTPPFELSKDRKNAQVVLHNWPEKGFSAESTDMWILSGQGGSTFLKLRNNNDQLKANVKIPSNDWLHDFCPVLQVGKFAVFEFKIPEYKERKGDLSKRINEAIKAVEKMEGDLRKSEWNRVIEDSRPIWELLRNVDKIKDLLLRDGYTEEAAGDLNAIINKLFDYSSKFHHKLGKPPEKKIMYEIKASKEDAYFMYTTGLAFANMISKKTQRLDIG